MSLGMRNAGIEIIAGIDNDPDCRETYEANHKGSSFISADVTDLPVTNLGAETGIRCNDDKLIFIGCSPCQYWSIITGRDHSGRKKSSRVSRSLLKDFQRFVEHYRPGFVVIENVRGVERNPDQSGLANLLYFFDENGYRTASGILSVNDFGVPQTRRRFILVASRVVRPISLPEPKGKRPCVWDAIGERKGLPPIKAGEPDLLDNLHRSPGLSEKNIKRLRKTPGGSGRRYWHNNADLQIPAYHGRSVEYFRDNYGRMSWDKPAPTITTKFFAIGCGKFGHPEQDRTISLREGAMLQTFPKSYQFRTTGFVKTARLIGNAVPPKFARAIGQSIVEQWQRSSTKRRALD